MGIAKKAGDKPQAIELSSDDAIKLYTEAVDAAIKVGLPYHTDKIRLTPSDALTQLLQRSQEIAATADASEEA
ncbi:MAG: hypothetical protein R3C56_20865 [Pirellulaceae bacterium]